MCSSDLVPANFGAKVPKAALLFHVQVVEVAYVVTGSNHYVARRHGLRSRQGEPILAGDPGVVWRSRAEEAGPHKVHESLRPIHIRGFERRGDDQRLTGEQQSLLQFENSAARSQTGP